MVTLIAIFLLLGWAISLVANNSQFTFWDKIAMGGVVTITTCSLIGFSLLAKHFFSLIF